MPKEKYQNKSLKMFKNQLFLITYCLILIGTVFISTASLFEAQTNFDNQYFFLQKQIIWIAIGTLIYLVMSKINIDKIRNLTPLIYLISIVFLVLVYVPGLGHTVFGARRWLDLGPLRFQPSEIFKIASLLFFSHLFSKPDQVNLKNLTVFGLPALALILFQPSLSTTILSSVIIFSIYFFSKSNLKDILLIVLVTCIALFIAIISTPYRLDRFNQNYHSQQLTISLASGTLFGKGIGNSIAKFSFVPQISTDSILAIIGEEVGFVGMTFLFFVFYLLIKNIINITHKAKNEFQQLFSIGLATWIFAQSAINISAITGLIPLTGISLPFISYGGSSLLSLLVGIGLLENINRQAVK